MLTIAEIAELYRTKRLHPNWHFWVDNDNVVLYVPEDRVFWTKDPHKDVAACETETRCVWRGDPEDFMFELCEVVGIYAAKV